MAFNLTDASGKSVWSAITLGSSDLAKLEYILEQCIRFLKNISVLEDGKYRWGESIIPTDSEGKKFIDDDENSKLNEVLKTFCENLGVEEINDLSVLVHTGNEENHSKVFTLYGENVQYNIVSTVEELITWLSSESEILGKLLESGEDLNIEDIPESSYLGQLRNRIDGITDRLDNFKKIAESNTYLDIEEVIEALEGDVDELKSKTKTNRGFIDVLLGGNTETEYLVQTFLGPDKTNDRWEALENFLNTNNKNILSSEYIRSESILGKILIKISNNDNKISTYRDALSVLFSAVDNTLNTQTSFPATSGNVLENLDSGMSSMGDASSVIRVLNNLLYYARSALMLSVGDDTVTQVVSTNVSSWSYSGKGVFTIVEVPAGITVKADNIVVAGCNIGRNIVFENSINISFTSGNLKGVLYKN